MALSTWGRREWEVTANGFLFWEMKMFWDSILVMVIQFCEYAKKPLNGTLFFSF